MNLEEAQDIIGNRAGWELNNMIKALSAFTMLNTDEENKRLEAAKIVRKASRRKR